MSTPQRFGWPYDLAVIMGFGYGGADPAAIAATLDRPEVEAFGLAAMATDSTIDGEPVPLVAGRPGFDALRLPVVDGELPAADGEIALGAVTARLLGLSVGDKDLVAFPQGEREATVRGLVVMPSIGPYEAAWASLGTGRSSRHRSSRASSSTPPGSQARIRGRCPTRTRPSWPSTCARAWTAASSSLPSPPSWRGRGGLALGLPIGVSLGRRSYRAFATGLGFFPEPEVSVTWTLVITAAAVGTGLLASAGPAFGAARSATADALRQE